MDFFLRRGFPHFTTGLVSACAGIYVWDQQFNSRGLSRSLRTLIVAATIGVDYKLNWKAGNDCEALHRRSAERLYNLITSNKGLYVKMGQMVAVQAQVLPAAYGEVLSRLFDHAPEDSWDQVKALLDSELKVPMNTLFMNFEQEPVASASIAQVHRATLRSGEQVAVKVQHSEVENLTKWDLWAYKTVMWGFESFVFHLPLQFIAKFIADHIQRETDFRVEGLNAEKMRDLVSSQPSLGIYVPKVYHALSTKRILIMEWIDGTPLSKREEVKAQFDVESILSRIFRLTGQMCFNWGFVHCDPHPGNWIITRKDGHMQVVMLDHALYMELTPTLIEQYTSLWGAILNGDMKTISEIARTWGFKNTELFASATLLQKFNDEDVDDFEDEEKVRQRFTEFLEDSDKLPLELLFIARSHRILQGINRIFDSPVNRLKILADDALTAKIRQQKTKLGYLNALIWRIIVLFISDLGYLLVRIRQIWSGKTLEDYLDSNINESSESLLK